VTQAYVRLLESAPLRKKLGDAGRERARRVFDWSVIVRRYQALWGELAELRRAAPARPTRAYPLRDDPFRVFRAFPSIAIGAATRVEAVVPEPAAAAARVAASTMSGMTLPFLLGREELQQLLGALVPGRRVAVAELEGLFRPERRPALLRSLAWLAKGGIIRLAAK
jgi:alpha-maltose-1-phosphate synthase